ncbi:MAG: NAD(P)H-hydrate dehydratase [Chitinivibrionales bacterium]|nr:NAD(P)H-hydrate dehydratase [Chitinivibrionales bacterium]
MLQVLTTSQMRSIDDQAINNNVAVGYSYMLRAAIGIVDVIVSMDINPRTDEIAIVCGKGKNGGDGYTVGRMLIDRGYKVMCFGLCGRESLSGEAYLAFDEYVMRDGNFFLIDDIVDLEGFGRFALIIDALLGTGIKGDPRGLYAEIIKMIDTSGKPVVSIDTPSGLNNDSGRPGNTTVRATCTVTMGFPKIGQLFYPARSYVGRLVIKDLGYPMEICEQQRSNMFLPTLSDVRQKLPPRKPAGSKFDHGLALLLCGSVGMTGSAHLCSMAALRSGCGMAHCIVPKSIVSILSTKVIEAVLHGIDETEQGTPGKDNINMILDLAADMQALLIGPGISHNTVTSELVRTLLARITIPVVLDADGINAFKGCSDELKNHQGDLIITPHAKEWERLFGAVPAEPMGLVTCLGRKAQEFGMTIVYKGNPTVVADSEGKIFILPVGSSGMASAGSGDVLSGILVSLLAQGAAPTDAAIAGVAIHGLAGETAAAQFSDYGMIARDIIVHIGSVLKKISSVRHYSFMFEE